MLSSQKKLTWGYQFSAPFTTKKGKCSSDELVVNDRIEFSPFRVGFGVSLQVGKREPRAKWSMADFFTKFLDHVYLLYEWADQSLVNTADAV